MALHFVWVTERDPETGEDVHRESYLLDYAELLKPDRVAKLYATANGLKAEDLKVNIVRE